MRVPLALILIILVWTPSHSEARLLRVATLVMEPFYKNTSGGQEGYLVDLMEDLIERINVGTDERVQYRFYQPADGKFGTVDEHGRWNGIMGEVINGEADLAVAPLTITKERSQAVYVSHPFMTAMIVPLIKRPGPGKPFPFNNLADLRSKLQAGNLTLGYLQHGSTEAFLRNHKLPLVRAIYDLSKAAHTPSPYLDNYSAGVERVRNDPRFVFYGEHVTFQYAQNHQHCDLAIGWSGSIGERYYGFVFRKAASGRQWMEKFNEALLAAQEDGTAASLYSKWWWQRSTCPALNLCMCSEEANTNGH